MTREDAQRHIHDAIQATLPEGEVLVTWTLTADVASIDGGRYLAHRAGGGDDGNTSPTPWTALGMLRSSVEVAGRQVLENTRDPDPPIVGPESPA